MSAWGRFVWRLPQGLSRWEIVGGSRLSPDPSAVRGELASEGSRKAGCADDCQRPVSTGLPLSAAPLRAAAWALPRLASLSGRAVSLQ